MYLCRQLTPESLQSIGKALGKKDHTTVIHGIEKITEEIKVNEELKNRIEIITKKINKLTVFPYFWLKFKDKINKKILTFLVNI